MDQPGPPLLEAIGLRSRLIAVSSALALALLPSGPAGAAAVTVQTVEVRLTVSGTDPPSVVRSRLQETVQTVVQRLLVGRAVEQVRPAQAQLQAALATVVDRVVTGYLVADVRLEVAATAIVALQLRPDPPLVQSVEIVPRVGVHPAVAPLVLAPIERDVTPALRGMLVGVPVKALDWVGPLIAEETRRSVERLLPGFTATIRLRAGALARADLEISAGERVVRDIGVRFRSSSIPTMLLEGHAPAVVSFADPLRGLPIPFVEAQREALQRMLDQRLRAYPPVAEYDVVARVVLKVGETTYLTVLADSMVWRGRLEAVVNLGSQAPAPELRLHLGRLFDRFELYAEAAIPPNTFAGRYDLGARYGLTEALDVGGAVALNAVAVTAWVTYRLSPDVSARLAYEVYGRRLEGSLRYRFHEFLSGELVGTKDGEIWLRLISNL